MTLYVLFSWIFLFPVAAFEFRRFKRSERADAFSLISLAFVVAFVLAPSVLYWTAPDDGAFTKFIWMQHLTDDGLTYALATLMVVISYLCIYAGYISSRAGTKRTYEHGHQVFLIAGLILTVGGMIAFVLFLEIVGGPVEAFQKSWFLRAGTPADLPLAQFAFAKRLAFLVVPGSVFLIQAASRRATLWPFAVLGVVSALFILTFMQGRLQLTIYIAPLLMAMWLLKYRTTRYSAVAGLCWICLVFAVPIGTQKLLQPIPVGPQKQQQASTAIVQVPAVATSLALTKPTTGLPSLRTYYLPQKVTSIGLEFAFPFCNLLSALTKKPDFRWFIDLVLPIFHLIPKRIVPVGNYLPPTLSELNTLSQVGPVPWSIPVDLVTFGYFSLGWLGVSVASFGFGWVARRVELMMPAGTYGDEVFRLSWIVMIGALVMYGDPNWFVIEQFHWIVAFLIFVVLIRYGFFAEISRAFLRFR